MEIEHPTREKPQIIRPAATILIVRDTQQGLEVLALKRSAQMRFLPNYLAFPGGRVQASDEEVQETSMVGEIGFAEYEDDARFAVAAIREAAEETGLLVAVASRQKAGLFCLPVDESMQAGLLSEQLSFHEVLQQQSLVLRADRVRFVGRWITPSFMPARFDTRFFVTQWQGEVVPIRSNPGENEWVAWCNPERLLLDIEAGRSQAVRPTIAMLHALVEAKTTTRCMTHLHVPSPR
jgi:8-oxo-dGTP pyrophosphatase MutT (NUDIX family)